LNLCEFSVTELNRINRDSAQLFSMSLYATKALTRARPAAANMTMRKPKMKDSLIACVSAALVSPSIFEGISAPPRRLALWVNRRWPSSNRAEWLRSILMVRF
jgi:hypothetical protein